VNSEQDLRLMVWFERLRRSEMEQEIEKRLGEAIGALEAALARMEQPQTSVSAATNVAHINATVTSEREEELERKLAEAETKLAQLQANGHGGRKTASVGRMAAKEAGEANLAGALDGALRSLSVEQRIAVKAELLRAGVM